MGGRQWPARIPDLQQSEVLVALESPEYEELDTNRGNGEEREPLGNSNTKKQLPPSPWEIALGLSDAGTQLPPFAPREGEPYHRCLRATPSPGNFMLSRYL